MQTLKINIGIILFLFSLTSCSQSNEFFQNFKSKFMDCELPIKGEDLSKGDNISKEEFDSFTLESELWKYEDDYYYNSSVKFPLDNNIHGYIYIRSYYPDSIENEKMEIVLVTFDKDGNIISSLPIHGIHGDESVFYGSIDKNYYINIDFQKFSIDNNTGESVILKDKLKYQIMKNSGKIKIIE